MFAHNKIFFHNNGAHSFDKVISLQLRVYTERPTFGVHHNDSVFNTELIVWQFVNCFPVLNLNFIANYILQAGNVI